MSDIKQQVAQIVSTLENPECNYCPECAVIVMDDLADCPDCGAETIEMSGYEYLTDVLDIEYIVNAAKEYLGARVLVCFGGPTVWINTRTNTVEGNWWGDSYTESYTDSIGLDETLQEIWESAL